ncbi:hypothetical protein BH24ACT8_BH24ACT8_06740 [soil metagenome]
MVDTPCLFEDQIIEDDASRTLDHGTIGQGLPHGDKIDVGVGGEARDHRTLPVDPLQTCVSTTRRTNLVNDLAEPRRARIATRWVSLGSSLASAPVGPNSSRTERTGPHFLCAFVDRIASNLTVDDLDIVTNGMAARAPATADPAAAPLPTQERELLWEHSGLGGRGRWAGEETLALAGSANAKAASVAAHALGKLLARSLTAGQFAARIDRDPSNVTRAANDGRLHAIRVGRERRFPTWQVQEEDSVAAGTARGRLRHPGRDASRLGGGTHDHTAGRPRRHDARRLAGGWR